VVFLVTIAVGLAGYVGFRRVSDYILRHASIQMDSKLDHVFAVLAATNSIYLNLVRSSMAVLRTLCQEKGEPHLDWKLKPDGSPEAFLYFGKTLVAGDYTLVDRVKEMMGGAATIFARQGAYFRRHLPQYSRRGGIAHYR
jgi:methyl-accepting chemotaxis protein